MRLTISISLFISLLISPFLASAAQIAPPPDLAVKAYLLEDFNSGSIIASSKKDERIEPASLTKIMTAYITFDAIHHRHLKRDQTLLVSEKAWKTEGSKMFIEPNTPVTVDELLHGMIIQSGNDASITLAMGVAGTEEQFAEMMNKQAVKLGLTNTHFMNATGLPDKNHYTTANDLAILATALIRDFPQEYKRLYSVKEYTYPTPTPTPDKIACKLARAKQKLLCDKADTQPKILGCISIGAEVTKSCYSGGITQPNRNRLLWLDPTVDGMKTGHTDTAGYCLIASSKRDNFRLVSVVLGADTEAMRISESQKLLNYGFQFYESTLVYKQSKTINILRVYKGQNKTVAATVAKDYYLTLPKGDYARLKVSMVSQRPLIAPIKAGQEIGKISFTLDGKIINEQKLVAATAIDEAGFFGRMLDSIRLLVK
jgi:serine-type D-Ala-D-Ala carboxypeptidase (penicillin-binding protein 5/6)